MKQEILNIIGYKTLHNIYSFGVQYQAQGFTLKETLKINKIPFYLTDLVRTTSGDAVFWTIFVFRSNRA